MSDQTTEKTHNIYAYIGGAVVVIASLLTLLFLNEGRVTPPPRLAVPTKPLAPQTISRGTLSLSSKTGSNLFTYGSTIGLQLTADSAGEDIVGLDAVIVFDQQAASFVQARSLTEGFRVFSQKGDGVVSLTLVKDLSVKNPTIFANQPVVELTFSPKKRGSATFDLVDKRGVETTKMVNSSTHILEPSRTSFQVEIN